VTDDATTIPAFRVSWHADGPDTKPRSTNLGVEIEYAHGKGHEDQQVAANEYISLNGANLLGPQSVQHRADLRYGHVGLSGITRFGGKASGLELQWVAGIGQSTLNLRSESRASSDPALTAKYRVNGLTLGVGPRWYINKEFAAEARVQGLWSWAQSDYRFWYPEVALRYLLAQHAAFRLGYSGMGANPTKRQGGDSPVEVRISGPFLALDMMF
jgi:hypothetical protein